MPIAYLGAKVYGIGELLTRKKRFEVPTHQRDYAWTEDEVDRFLDDILGAIDRGADEYFLGLIVLIGPSDSSWQILDGQQRLATTTMLFSAIRHWLESNGFMADATQIESEFIGTRKLGEEPSPRLTLNVSNREPFMKFVVSRCSDSVLVEYKSQVSKRSSNFKLADAAIKCRTRIDNWVMESSTESTDRVQALYSLANFVETQVQIVCLEISSEADAYLIFETLNYRGNDLTILDLVKNYLFSVGGEANNDIINSNWQAMADALVDRDTDDFLKVVWTAKYGRIQRGGLFGDIRERYAGSELVLQLSKLLAESAEMYLALEDASHPLWTECGEECSHYVSVLAALRARQVRPILLAALYRSLSKAEIAALLWNLIVLTVRHQTVGRRRTGVLEIACAGLARDLSSNSNFSVKMLSDHLRKIAPNDKDFFEDFLRYSELNSRRTAYVLSVLEMAANEPEVPPNALLIDRHFSGKSGAAVSSILPKGYPLDGWDDAILGNLEMLSESINRLGNKCLLSRGSIRQSAAMSFDDMKNELFCHSDFSLTRELCEYGTWNRNSIEERQRRLAELAVKAWQFRV